VSNSKISALTSATIPLAGTETLPIVQSSVTKQVSVADLTAGRSVSVSKLTTTNATDVVIENIIDQPNPLYYSALTLKNSGASGKSYQLSVGGNTSAVPGGMYIYNATAGTIPLTLVDASNNLTVGLGNVVIGTSGKGIDFSATPSTGTSELLADYEEGTWTPTDVSGAGLSLSGSGEYTKIGNMVKAGFSITYPVTGSALQNFVSLPVNSNGGGGFFVTYTTFGSAISGYIDGTNNRFVIVNFSGTALTNAALSTTRIDGVLIYRAA
jgi:hypothetical protein